ncbi:unnamed protein product [Schistosoma haematobium]|nr:unnamed protein product [Schistosoma haematobium]
MCGVYINNRKDAFVGLYIHADFINLTSHNTLARYVRVCLNVISLCTIVWIFNGRYIRDLNNSLSTSLHSY